MRHIGRNLLVHSDKRAIMVNSAGQVIFEQPFDGAGKAVVEIFKDKNGEIWTVLTKEDQVIVYKQNNFFGQFRIVDEEAIPEGFEEDFEPYELIYDYDLGKLLLVCRNGRQAADPDDTDVKWDTIRMATYVINYVDLSAR